VDELRKELAEALSENVRLSMTLSPKLIVGADAAGEVGDVGEVIHYGEGLNMEQGPGIATLPVKRPDNSVAWLDEDLLCDDA
jgi:hypothetical protein